MILRRYIGDGVTVSVEDGMLKLETPRENGMHVIYLESEVYEALIEFVADATIHMRKTRADAGEGELIDAAQEGLTRGRK